MKLLWLMAEVLWSLRMGGLGLVAIFLALYVVWKKAREAHVDDNSFFEGGFGAVVWSVVAARAIYVLMHMGEFGGNPVKWLWLTKFPGLDFVGGVIGLGLWLWWWVREAELEWWEVGDWSVLGLSMVNAVWSFARWGSVKEGVLLWGWKIEAAAVVGLSFVTGFLIWSLLWNVENKYRLFAWYKGRKGQANPGLVVALFLMLVGLQRLVIGVMFEGEEWYGYGGMMAMGVVVLLLRMGKLNKVTSRLGRIRIAPKKLFSVR